MVLVVLALGAPTAVGSGWNAKGGHEPDTLRDYIGQWMFHDPNTDPAKRMVYFNGWEGHGALSNLGVPGTLTATLMQSSFDPNVGAVGSSISGQDYAFYAMLGEWLDCNGDGYVGFGEQGLFEYRAELLIPFSGNPCPQETAVPRPIPLDWLPPHNDGKWVREMLPISWSFAWAGVGGSNDLNPWNLNDNGSRVWVDYGYPEDAQAPPKCQLNPAPRGTFHSTGGTLSWADCSASYRGTQLFDAVVDTAGHHEYSFADHPQDAQNSRSQANIANPWGTSQDASAVRMWDCAAPRAVEQSQYVEGWPILTNRTVYVNVSSPSPGVGSTNGVTPAGTTWGVINYNCATSTGTTLADAPYALEGNVAQLTARNAPTGYMHPIEITRPVAPYAVALGPSTPPGPGDGVQGDGDLGVGLTSRNDFWTDNVDRRGEGPLMDTRSTTISPPQRVSYYAYVSPSAVTKYHLTLPHGSTVGAYLAESCGTSTGVSNGWDCDGSHWWKTIDGADAKPRVRYLGQEAGNTADCASVAASNAFDYANPSTTAANSRGCVSIAVVPGSPYDLRDLDCYDQSVAALRQAQVSWGLLGSSYCDPAP